MCGGGGGGGADLGIFRLTKVTCSEAMVTGLAFQPQQGVCVLMLVCVCVCVCVCVRECVRECVGIGMGDRDLGIFRLTKGTCPEASIMPWLLA